MNTTFLKSFSVEEKKIIRKFLVTKNMNINNSSIIGTIENKMLSIIEEKERPEKVMNYLFIVWEKGIWGGNY